MMKMIMMIIIIIIIIVIIMVYYTAFSQLNGDWYRIGFHFPISISAGSLKRGKCSWFLIANGSLQILLGTDDVFEHLTTLNLTGIGFFQFKKYLRIKV